MGMRRGRTAILLAAVIAAGCEKLPARDVERVSQLQARYASRYDLSAADVYLSARARPGVSVNRAEAEKIFTDFFLPSGTEVQSSLVYLNLYDERGKFLYQLYYDEATRRIVRGQTEHY